jgi:hypothetical protein
MKPSKILTVLITIFVLYGCPFSPNGDENYSKGYFPDVIVNFVDLNSEFDDINMALLELHSYNAIAFSSNRLSSGRQYDIVGQPVNFIWDQREGSFNVDIENDAYSDYNFFSEFLEHTHSEANEYGPYVLTYKDNGYLFYASDQNGSNDVVWMKYKNALEYINFTPQEVDFDTVFSDPNQVPFLSSPDYNEGYISFRTSTTPYDHMNIIGDSLYFESLVYCNDSTGNYDIYEIEMPDSLGFLKFITSDYSYEKKAIEAVNSTYNDRCPNVCGNFMVFSSDRPGGLGGYDFYYSVYENGQWGEPVNFGTPINSESDEYRAIAINTQEYENDLLLFSSDRPEGIGGFDIYYTGIDEMPVGKYE